MLRGISSAPCSAVTIRYVVLILSDSLILLFDYNPDANLLGISIFFGMFIFMLQSTTPEITTTSPPEPSTTTMKTTNPTTTTPLVQTSLPTTSVPTTSPKTTPLGEEQTTERSTTLEVEVSTAESTTEGKKMTLSTKPTTIPTKPTTQTPSSQPPEEFESTTAERTTLEDIEVNFLCF